MKKTYVLPVILALTLLLAGCKETLLSGLPEESANQIIATLSQYHIDANKNLEKSGAFSVLVDRDKFDAAVFALRSNGLPRPTGLTIEKLFPPGQFISSPDQEKAKLNAIREDKIGSMLYSISGVMQASVVISESSRGPLDEAPPKSSVAVVIRYAPSVQLTKYEEQIRNVVRNAVPRAVDADISVTLIPAEEVVLPHLNQGASGNDDWFAFWASILAATAGACAIVLIGWKISHGLFARRINPPR